MKHFYLAALALMLASQAQASDANDFSMFRDADMYDEYRVAYSSWMSKGNRVAILVLMHEGTVNSSIFTPALGQRVTAKAMVACGGKGRVPMLSGATKRYFAPEGKNTGLVFSIPCRA